MAEAEKMTALKKAYADVMLNMAQESAARIMASERRVLGLQMGLSSAKEEALAMLLRLKGTMQSKIEDTEQTCASQARRIQELELQLFKSEATVQHLRAELLRVHSELEKKNVTVEGSNKQESKSRANSSEVRQPECRTSNGSVPHDNLTLELKQDADNNPITSQESSNFYFCDMENASNLESLKCFSAENDCGGSHELVSMLLRSKEPGLYRNVCTQRIHALDRNLLAQKRSDPQVDGQLSSTFALECGEVQGERPFSSDHSVPLEPSSHAEGNSDIEEADRKIEKAKNTVVAPVIKACGMKQRCFNRRTQVLLQSGIFALQDLSEQSCSRSSSKISAASPDRDASEDDRAPIKPLILTNTVKEDSKQASQVEGWALTSPEPPQDDYPCPASCPDKDDSLVENPVIGDDKAGESSEALTPAGCRNFITYAKKRKRGSPPSCNSGKELPQKTNATSNRTLGNKQCHFGETPERVVSARESRRVAQVARQLISLSTKRWQ